MIQLVRNNEIVFPQKRRNRSRIRRESRLKNHAGLDILKARDLLFQLHVDFHRARDGAHRARSHAILARSLQRRFAQLWMRREAEVIIRGKVDHALAVESTKRRLLVVQHAQLEVGALGLEFVKLIGQERKRIGARGSGHGLPQIRYDLTGRGKTHVSYQGIASAIPSALKIKCPLRGWASSIAAFLATSRK